MGGGSGATCSNCEKTFTVRDLQNFRYSSYQRLPRLLPCGHAVCDPCLRLVINDKTTNIFVCGICNNQAPCGTLKEVDADFPLHYYLVGSVISKANSKDSKEPEFAFKPPKSHPSAMENKRVFCHECEIAVATCICQKCNSSPYCDQCFCTIHGASKTLRSHTRDALSGLHAVVLPTCSKHGNCPLEWYCEIDQEMICGKCSILFHKDHAIIEISKKNEEMLPSLMETLEEAKLLKRRMELSLKAVRELSGGDGAAAKGGSALAAAERDLALQMAHVHGRLQVQERRAAGRLAEKRSAAQSSLGAMEAGLVAGLAELRDAVLAVRSSATPDNLATAHLEEVKKRLDKAMAAPCHLVHEEAAVTVCVKNADMLDVDVEIPVETPVVLLTREEIPPEDLDLPLDVDKSDDFDINNLTCNTSQSNKSTASTDSVQEPSSLSSSSAILIPAGMMRQQMRTRTQLIDPLDTLAIGSATTVSVCHIKSPSEFFVVLESAVRKLDVMSRAITKKALQMPPVEKVHLNKLYAVKDSDDAWYRGIILSKNSENEDKYQVLFVDHGSTVSVKRAFIRELSSQFTEAAHQAVRCGLAQLHPPSGSWTLQDATLMSELIIGPMMMHILDRQADQLLVDLSPCGAVCGGIIGGVESMAPASVRDRLMFLGVGSFQEGIHSSPLRKKYPRNDDIPLGIVKPVLLAYSEGPSRIFVHLDPQVTLRISEQIPLEVSAQGMERSIISPPMIGMPCLAKYTDNNWYRARVLDVSEKSPSTILVKYVDFGNEAIVDIKQIINIPDSLLVHPEQAIACCLAEVSPKDGKWSSSLDLYLKQYEGQCFSMEVVSQEHQVYNVVLYQETETKDICLNGLLVQNKLAESSGHRSLLSEFQKNDEDLNQVKKENREVSRNLHIAANAGHKKRMSREVNVSSSSSDDGIVENIQMKMGRIAITNENKETYAVLLREKDAQVSSELIRTNETSSSVSISSSTENLGASDSETCTDLVSNQNLSEDNVQALINGDKHLKRENMLNPSNGNPVLKDEDNIKNSSKAGVELKEENTSNFSKGCAELKEKNMKKIPKGCTELKEENAKNLPKSITVVKEEKSSLGRNADKVINNAHDTQQKSSLPNNHCSQKVTASRSAQSRLKINQEQDTLMRVPIELLSAESPSLLFVRLASQRTKIESMMNNMQSFYNDGGLLKESSNWLPEVSGRCAVMSSVDSMWYRAIVLEVLSDTLLKVNFKDIGRTEIVPLSAIRKLAPIFLHTRDGSIKCHLSNVKAAGGLDSSWSSLACEKLNEILKQHSSNLYISKNGQISEERSLPVALWVRNFVSEALEPTKENWFTVNKNLVDSGAALPIDWASMSKEDVITPNDYNILNPSDEPDKTYLEYLQEVSSSEDYDTEEGEIPTTNDKWKPSNRFPEGEFLGLPTYVDMACHVYIHDISQDTKTLAKVSKHLNRMFTDSNPGPEDSFWFKNQMCSVQYHLDNSWYRGKVTQVKANNQLKVQMVDYGNIETCRSSEVRKRVACREIPILARKCRIEGLMPTSIDGEWDLGTLDAIHGLLVDQPCDVKVLRAPTEKDNVHLVDITIKNRGCLKGLLYELKIAAEVVPQPLSSTLSDEEPDAIVLEELTETQSSKFRAVKSFLSSKFMPVTFFDSGPLNQTYDPSHRTAGNHLQQEKLQVNKSKTQKK